MCFVKRGFAVALLCFFITPAKAETNRQSEVCLARVIFHEARGESEIGQRAVARVVFNRMNDARFPNTICGIVYQRRNGICQFSWVCASRKARETGPTWEASLNLARLMLIEDHQDHTGGATFFSRPGRLSLMRYVLTTNIGRHQFYRLRQNP